MTPKWNCFFNKHQFDKSFVLLHLITFQRKRTMTILLLRWKLREKPRYKINRNYIVEKTITQTIILNGDSKKIKIHISSIKRYIQRVVLLRFCWKKYITFTIEYKIIHLQRRPNQYAIGKENVHVQNIHIRKIFYSHQSVKLPENLKWRVKANS